MHDRPGGEGAQVQRRLVEEAGKFGVRRVVHLEPAVEAPSVHQRGAHAAAHAVGGFEQCDGAARSDQVQRAGDPGEAGAHDDHVGLVHAPQASPRAGLGCGQRERELGLAS